MVLKGVNRVHNDKIGANGLERSQLGTQYKNEVICYWKESIGYRMIKLGQMVLKGVNRVHYDKIRSNGLERSQLGTQCKHMCAFMHHIHIHEPPNTTKIPPRYTQLAFPLYSLKHEVIMRDLCWIRCFCCLSVKSTVLFSEKWSLMKSAVLLSEKYSAFQWKVQFDEKRSAFQWKVQFDEKHSAFQWNVQLHEKHSTFHWKAQWKVQCFSVKSTVWWKVQCFSVISTTP